MEEIKETRKRIEAGGVEITFFGVRSKKGKCLQEMK
jgi:hypothetical protein